MIIIADGTHKITKKGDVDKFSTSIIYVSGTFDSATAKLVYYDESGTAVDLIDGALTVNNQYKIEHGRGVDLYVTVASAGGSTSININQAGLS